MNQENKNSSEEITLVFIIRKLTDTGKSISLKRKFIFLNILVFALLGLGIAFLLTPTYKASISFMIDDSASKNQLSGLMSLASQFGGAGNGASSFSEENIVEILKTRNIFNRALLSSINIDGKNDLLANHYIHIANKRSAWNENSKLRDFTFKNTNTDKLSFLEDSILGTFYADIMPKLEIEKQGNMTSILKVSFSFGDEIFTEKFTNMIVNSVSNYYVALKTEKSRKTLSIIQNRADSVQAALISAEYGLAKWKDSRNMVVKMLGNVEEGKLSRNVQILNVMFAEIVKQLEIAKISVLDQTPLIQVVDRPILPLTKTKLSKLKAMIIASILGALFSIFYVLIKGKISEIMENIRHSS